MRRVHGIHARLPLASLLAAGVLFSGYGCGSSSGGSSNPDGGGSGEGGPGGPDGSTDSHLAKDVPGSDAPQPCDGPCTKTPTGLLNPDYTTTWNPGILSDTATKAALGPDGLPVRTTTCQTIPAQSGDATSAIQNALNACQGKNQVVMLAVGTYSISSSITVPSGVVLRGAGTDLSSGTVIVSKNGGPVLTIGTQKDQVCYQGSFDGSAQPKLSSDAMKETATVSVASAAGFSPGDLALIDQMDDSEVSEGDCGTYFKRTGNYGVSQRVEIASVSGNTLTLTTPLHWTFKTSQMAQISRVAQAPVKWAGIEDLRVQGGRPGGYAGQNAGGVDVSNAAYSWVKNVEVDGTTSGMGIRLAGTYRAVVRDSHVHNSYSYGFGQDNYGIVLACGAADDLVENNIARFMNKPILFNNSGGGNVIGYNYADNSWSCDGNNDDGYQEVNIDSHCAFPHMELMEGNWAPHMGATVTHGNAGYLTWFRNYGSSQWSPSMNGMSTSAIVWSQPFAPQYANVGAFDFPTPDVNMTVIGNVLGSTSDTSLGLPTDLGTTGTGMGSGAATTQDYTGSSGGAGPSIFLIDQTAVPWTSLWLTGNFDTFNKKLMWNASPPTASLPASTQKVPVSLYRATRPGWWPAGTPWPWTGPDLKPMVGSLPAEARSAAYSYYETSDPSCNLNCGSYCCNAGPACSL